MTIHFARRHSSADAMIEDLLEEWKSPRTLLVVSSDHRVQRAARHRGAKFIDSEQWHADLVARRRKRKTAGKSETAKPVGRPTPDELAYWLNEFGETPDSKDDFENPFPPGYADDVEQKP